MSILKVRTEFALALNQVCHERGIEPEIVLETIREAVLAAYRKDFGEEKEGYEFESEIDPDTGGTKIFSFPEGKKKKKRKEITPPGFGRIAAQVAKQVILQKIREAEKDAILSEYSERVGTIMNGMILRFDGPNIIVDIGKTEAVMPIEEQIRSEHYRFNQRLTVYMDEIRETPRGRRVIVSRSSKGLIEGLFKREVPEVSSGAVKIEEIAREAGARSKVAVISTQPGVDPVGSCVGQKGVRVQAVINELSGEKIDIIPYSPEIKKFIIAALSPAENIRLSLDEELQIAEAFIPDDQLSLAIGKAGQNVRLAAKLTGYKIDIKSAEEAQKSEKDSSKSKKASIKSTSPLEKLGLSTRIVKSLVAAGIEKKSQLKKQKEADLAKIKGIGPKAVEKILKALK